MILQGISTAAVFSMLSDEDSFEKNSRSLLAIAMIIGAVAQFQYPYDASVHDTDALVASTRPKPMVHIRGLTRDRLEVLLAEFNAQEQNTSRHVHLAITNTSDQFIVAGIVASAAKLVKFLDLHSASPEEDQSKVPFSLRRPVISTSYLGTTAPHHCSLLDGAAKEAYNYAQEKGWVFDATDMRLPVQAGDDGHDIHLEKNLTRYLFESICVLPVNWPVAISAPDVTHIVHFGTGGISGFGQLARRNIEGRGIPVICAGALVPQLSHSALGTKGNLYQRQMSDVFSAPNWLTEFGPRLVHTAHDDKVHIDTRMQRILGSPTVMVAGMTPTTANESFVAAVNNAGYHAELAGGGMHSESEMVLKIKALAESIPLGQGITLNCIYVNPRQWSFQFPVLLRMRSEGLPIAGLCIGGGVPSFDVALEIISSLREAGIRHVSFKPSTTDAIRQTIRIANACNGFPVVLQWTGGRAGGHHSYEDFHQPILETYAAIRTCDNVALVAGSGFGDAEGSLPYLTGDWSMAYGRAPMPFDGILLGSRVMVAQEASTSLAAKQLIVAAQGLPDSDWHQTYDGVHNGVTTTVSEYGELNHVLATRAAMFIRDMHATILNQPRDKREALLLSRKDEIISRLNADYMRPWFGRKADGCVVDLEDMTYAEVIDRLVELMYVKHQKRWIHPSYLRFVSDFIGRVERRMCMEAPQFAFTAHLHDANPSRFGQIIAQEYPAAATQLLTSEDIQFFVHLCKRRGQKPVPFIPVLDADFGTLLQKDSIWQSEDLDAVVEQDPQRVGIQQGPVAARYSTTVNEPVKDILDGIYHSHIASLQERLYDGDESRIPVVEYIGNDPAAVTLPAAVQVNESEAERVFRLPEDSELLPELDTWLRAVAGPQKSWLRALLMSPVLVQGSTYASNYVCNLMRPRPGRIVAVNYKDAAPDTLVIFDASGVVELDIACDDNGAIRLTIHHQMSAGAALSLQLEFDYCPSFSLTPIRERKQKNDMAGQHFFFGIWSAHAGPNATYVDITNPSEVQRDNFVVDMEHTRAYCRCVNTTAWHYIHGADSIQTAPVDYLHISSTQSMLGVLQSTILAGGQNKIVHLRNRMVLADGASMCQHGDTISATMKITKLVNTQAGKAITMSFEYHVRGQKIGFMESDFLFRGYFIDTDRTFERAYKEKIVVRLPSSVEVCSLEANDWFVYLEGTAARLEPGALVEFCLDSEYRFANDKVYSRVEITGSVHIVKPTGQRIHIANVDYLWNTCTGNPVYSYLAQYQVGTNKNLFAGGGYPLVNSTNEHLAQARVPHSNHAYARISGDCNPIHVDPYIADFAGLPGTITHGLWTNGCSKAALERIVAAGHPERIRSFQVDFTDTVLPKDRLAHEFIHIGMKDGRMLINGQTSRVGGSSVMSISAEVDQPLTAYVFTGQGAQEAGMGMDLYQKSPVAQAVWDRANAHMLSTYGISLLNIVRANPATHTVYFNGKAGKEIRDSFRSMAKQAESGASGQHQLLPGMSDKSMSYTFRSPTGLLNSTQFTQAALVTAAMASVADLRSQGLVQKHALWGGHSLGEFAALAALGQVFSVEDILDVVFVRGLIMQSAVPRDAHGRSEYGMAAINPLRVGPAFSEDMLRQVVDEIGAAGTGLLQVVNYNVQGQQYVVSGTLASLEVLCLVLDGFAVDGVPSTDNIAPYIKQAACTVLESPARISPTRGTATIPLHGIDVPFHSQLLLGGVDALRKTLRAKLAPSRGTPLDALSGRYIPNLTAMPFKVTKEYFQLVFDATQSPVVGEVLRSWTAAALDDPAQKAKLAALLLVELLAYQLASPVQWIATQMHLFDNAGVQRLVEIGPSPILCGMATKTLESHAFLVASVEVLHIERDYDRVHYQYSPVQTIVKVADEPALNDSSDLPPSEQPATISAAALPEKESTGAAPPLADSPLPALDVVHAIVASKLKRSLDDISTKKSIKALVGGNSILQNEIVGDLQKEFGSRMPDKPEEMTLQELGQAIGSPGSLGKCTQPLVTRMLSSKMPGGFSLSSVRSILETAYGLGPQRQDALLLVALTMEPLSRLGSEVDAMAWLDKVVHTYATRAKISYTRAAGAAGGTHAAGPVVSSAEMEKMQQQQNKHLRQQIEVLARYAGIDLRKDGHAAETHQATASSLQNELDAVSAEFGDELIAGVRPQFDVRKVRKFDSYWNWARQDAYQWIQQAMTDAVAGKDIAIDDDRVHRLQIRADQELLQLLSGTAQILGLENNPALVPALELSHRLYDACKLAIDSPATYLELSTSCQPHTHISLEGEVTYTEIPRSDEPTFAEYIKHMRSDSTPGDRPSLHLCQKDDYQRWVYSESLSDTYFDSLSQMCGQGVSFAGKTALVTGCGRGSICAEVVRGLLMGGAKVLVTTSSYLRRTTLFFEDMYRQYGARGSELILVPFNQGSVQDIEALVNYIFGQPGSDQGGLGWNLDYVVPFGAVSDIGSSVSNLGSHSELAQRVLLTNTFRLMGRIKSAKETRLYTDRPSLVVLPMSPNHGIFGDDGLYGESKIGLETAFNRWESESWRGYLSIAGAVIGWTRGTGLMSSINMFAMGVERSGIRTFSAREMAFNVLGLLHPQVSNMAHWSPVWAVLDSGLGQADSFSELVAREKSRIEITSKQHQDVSLNAATSISTTYGRIIMIAEGPIKNAISILAKSRYDFPAPKSYESLEHLHHLQDMVNLDKVVVITGYGEVSPHGNAETRWEIEAFGELSIEGCIELAWIMGLIEHHNGQLSSTGEYYVGWVDAKSGEPVKDIDIKPQYEEYMLAHTGIRLIEPELSGGYNPEGQEVLREVQIDQDMEPFEASADDAVSYKKSNGDKVDIWENSDGSWSVRFLKGALIRVPAAASATRLVAGLLPTGWDARRFGIPKDIINQVDPVTLLMLVAVVEALVRSGITDPYQLYQHFHISEVGTTISSAAGGMHSARDVFRHRVHDKDINNDALQETFISTVQAWVNMLLISSAGPVMPVVGACTTAAVSIDAAVKIIQTGRAKVMLAGGVEDFTEESSNGFASMGATSNTVEEFASGRTPPEMSRPCTTTRSGFMEGHGAGAVVLMSAAAALEYGAPIYGVVGMTVTATDKQGRSVPAPGKGILGSACEVKGAKASRLLDINYRRRKLEHQLQALDAWRQSELDVLPADLPAEDMVHQTSSVEDEYLQQKCALQDICGNEFWKRDKSISPLRGSLAVWGLTADDIGLASFHGTSTKANDINESNLLNKQMEWVGRTRGHILPAVCQKWLTGHPKGAAASFMLNGVLQSLRTGIIPGNRNADNIDQDLKPCDYSLYLSQTIQTPGIRAALLKSFGFGQVGGEILVIHPDYILATLSQEQLEAYNQKLVQSVAKGDRYFQDTLVGNHPFVQVKSSPPYTTEQEQEVLLDPLARAHFNPATGEYQF
ncbi:fatty acid synthase alpha subunit Lsd1 [Coemansia sp. RSA 552]|nr:fatty acid synthase alpha subunit Lsd1 [Coemansia sp. RSA 552]